MKIKKLFLAWFGMPIWQQVMVGLILGIVTGLVFGESATLFKPLGDAFVNALHMVIVPVILSAVVCAVISVSDIKQIRRITFKSFVVYLCFLCTASMLAIAVGQFIQPGIGISSAQINSYQVMGVITQESLSHTPTLAEVLVAMVPKNPVAAFVNENILQIVLFGILLGVAINLTGEKSRPLAQLFHSVSEVSKTLTNIIMYFAPYGVFALISWTFGIFGFKAMWPLLKFIAVVFLSCSLLIGLVYCSIIVFYLRQSPIVFFKKIAPAIVFAMSTTSSGATLPISIRCAEEELRVSPSIAKFMLPLGCNFNLSGLAIYLTAAVIFTANIYGVVLSPVNYVMLILTVVLTTMGTGAIPGSGIIAMSAVITTMGMPLGALPLIAGIDRINDMIQTTTNVISDIFAAYLVSESEYMKVASGRPMQSHITLEEA